MSDVKSIVKGIYDNKPKTVRENLEAVISERAAQVVEARKIKIAKNLFGQK